MGRKGMRTKGIKEAHPFSKISPLCPKTFDNVYPFYQKTTYQIFVFKIFAILQQARSCNKVHPKVFQERLVYEDITLTLNTYSHILPTMQEDAAEKLDELLTPIDITDHIKIVNETVRTNKFSENPKL